MREGSCKWAGVRLVVVLSVLVTTGTAIAAAPAESPPTTAAEDPNDQDWGPIVIAEPPEPGFLEENFPVSPPKDLSPELAKGLWTYVLLGFAINYACPCAMPDLWLPMLLVEPRPRFDFLAVAGAYFSARPMAALSGVVLLLGLVATPFFATAGSRYLGLDGLIPANAIGAFAVRALWFVPVIALVALIELVDNWFVRMSMLRAWDRIIKLDKAKEVALARRKAARQRRENAENSLIKQQKSATTPPPEATP